LFFNRRIKLLGKYNKLPTNLQSGLAATELESIEQKYNTIIGKLTAKVVFTITLKLMMPVFGNHASKTHVIVPVSVAQTQL